MYMKINSTYEDVISAYRPSSTVEPQIQYWTIFMWYLNTQYWPVLQRHLENFEGKKLKLTINFYYK